MKILFTGGGTGGHIFPIIAIARELRNVYAGENLRLFFIGPKGEVPLSLLTEEGIKVKMVLAGKIRRYVGVKSYFLNFFDILFKIPVGAIQALFYVFFLSPHLILSKGGYGSVPALTAGWLLGTPIFLHESDAAPGLSNRYFSKYASEIFVSFPLQKTEYYPPPRIISVGNPIRKGILEGSKQEAMELFKLSGEKPLILILGGSQGAQRINDIILQMLPHILTEFELIHQCGERNFKETSAESKVVINKDLEKYYHPSPFLNEEEMGNAYRAADLVISRAGSGTIFEISAVEKPSILIPLPEAAQDHQVKNAYAYADRGACMVVEETNLAPHFLLERIQYLFNNPEDLEKMQIAAREFSRPKAAEVIAEYLIGYLTQ